MPSARGVAAASQGPRALGQTNVYEQGTHQAELRHCSEREQDNPCDRRSRNRDDADACQHGRLRARGFSHFPVIVEFVAGDPLGAALDPGAPPDGCIEEFELPVVPILFPVVPWLKALLVFGPGEPPVPLTVPPEDIEPAAVPPDEPEAAPVDAPAEEPLVPPEVPVDAPAEDPPGPPLVPPPALPPPPPPAASASVGLKPRVKARAIVVSFMAMSFGVASRG